MSRITDISTQKKRDTRANIYLDGKFCCGLEKITVLSEGLIIGDEIDTDTLADIQQKSESATAFDKATRYLSVRMRTEKEIRNYLRNKGYLPAVFNNVIKKLKEYHYIDDAIFCKQYIDLYRHRYGETKIRMELRRLGVNANTVEDALEDLGDQTDEAISSARKYIRTHSKADYRKLYAFLYGKGFKYDTVKTVMAEVADELNGKADEMDEDVSDLI